MKRSFNMLDDRYGGSNGPRLDNWSLVKSPAKSQARKRTWITLMFLLVGQLSFAQREVTGKVTSDEGEELPGVTILLKGTSTGTVTDLSGNYRFEVPSDESILIFSYVGHETTEVRVGARGVVDIQLASAIENLDEVVVIGYGSQKRSEISNAVASVESKDFLIGKIQDASDLIKGKVAGLVISRGSGDPNSNSTIMIRGVNSVYAGIAPLVLVDGIPADMNTVAPEAIESITVLKDGSSAAIYGTRGANGVILITTKSASRNQKPRISYTGYTSASDFLKVPDFMEPDDVRAGKTTFNDEGYNTYWLDAVTRTGFTNRHVVDVTGGSDNTSYSANLSYRYEAGTIIRSNNEQIKAQLGVDQSFFDNKLTAGIKLWKDYRTNSATDAASNGPLNIYRQALIRNPTSPIYNDNGEYNENFNKFQYYNPIAIARELDGENLVDRTTMIGSVTVEPIKNWKTRLIASQYNYNRNFAYFQSSKHFTSQTSGIPGTAGQSYDRERSNQIELTSEYNYDIEKHGITFMVGHGRYYNVYQGFGASNSDFATDLYLYNNLGSGSAFKEALAGRSGVSSYKHDNLLLSYFTRAHYSYADKYHVMASLRREGSSRFGVNEKWGVFPAVSAGWTISEETFMSSVTTVDNLKLRVGYGVTGRFPTQGADHGAYISIVKYNYTSNSYGNYLDANGEWQPTLEITQTANPYLKWETNEEWNLGLDFSILKSRISGAFDVFRKTNNDFIYNYRIPQPPNPTSTFVANAGTLENNGFEMLLNATPIRKRDFQWNTTLTISKFKTILKDFSNDVYESEDETNWGGLGDPVSVPTHRLIVGQPVGRIWGLKSVGVTDDGIWLIENPETGEAIEYSTSLNTDQYRQFLGSGYPKLYLGFNTSFTYKKFDLSLQTSGQFGFQIINEQRIFYQNNSIQYNKLKSAADPVYGNVPLSTAQAQAFVSYYVEDGDYLKFDNLTFGYNMSLFPDYIQLARLYLSAQNFLIITKYSGLDPELSNDLLAPGIDPRDKYPTIKSLTLGLNMTFK